MTETTAPPPLSLKAYWQAGYALQTLSQGHFFVWLPIFMGVGIGVYFSLLSEPDPRWFTALFAFGVVLPLLARRHAALLPFVWAISFAALGFALSGWHAHRAAAPVLDWRYYGPIEGRVVGLDRSASDKLRITLDQVRLDRIPPDERPARVRVSLHGEQRYLDPQPGQIIMMTGHLSPPSGPVEPGGFDFQRHAWFQQLGGVGYTRVPALLQAPAERGAFGVEIFRLRMLISNGIKDRMEGREGAFASAILTGDRSDVDQEALVALRASNLAHLLAISGLHMGMLTGVVFLMVRFGFALVPSVAMRTNPKKIGAVAAFVVAVSYLGISGASVATQRAFIMVSVMLVAVCLDRRALTLRAVAVAALIVLALSPEGLAGPGFQMSFAATTALVAIFAEIRDRQLMYGWPRWARNLASLVISSGIAGLATAPFGAYHFNQMSQWGLIANLLSVPVMGSVVMPGAVISGVLSLVGLEQIGIEIMRWGIKWILFVAETVAGWDSAVRRIASPGPWVLPLLGLGGATLCLTRGRMRVTAAPVLAAAFGLWFLSERPVLLVSDTGALIGLMTPEGRALNKARGDGFVAGAWLENDGDGADQEAASLRGGMGRKEARISVGGHDVAFVVDKDLSATDMARLCAQADLLILPQTKATPDCPAITERGLRRSGALAIKGGAQGLRITSTRDMRGDRLWTR
jgi:competence protein ComEC